MIVLLKNCYVIKDWKSKPEYKNILIEGNRIVKITEENHVEGANYVDLKGRVVIPGFVQTHVHFCQTLFKGQADDLPLLVWLRTKIWPLEASHNEESTYLSALLSGMELISGGTTSACVMESVRHGHMTGRAIDELGLRAVFGKVMMDYNDTPEELGGMPKEFFETTKETMDSSMELYKSWNGAADKRISYALMPRGILTTSEELLTEIKEVSEKYRILVHTHACETWEESKLVQEKRGLTEIKYLDKMGLSNERLLLAHSLCIDEEDIDILARNDIKVASCPKANLKLASGVAPLAKLYKSGVTISLGSDGAPCNNTLDTFEEMKFASLLQKGIYKDSTLMTAEETFKISTIGGARALGMEMDCGSIEEGKYADITVVDFEDLGHIEPNISNLVYSGNRNMVTDVMVHGKWLYRDREFTSLDREKIIYEGKKALISLLDRFERRG
ncbi:MAG: amidohydrolase family protein [Tissierellaceae bacterium]|nr:amidohydrolase family protein [Tissierellaceae bacterium]